MSQLSQVLFAHYNTYFLKHLDQHPPLWDLKTHLLFSSHLDKHLRPVHICLQLFPVPVQKSLPLFPLNHQPFPAYLHTFLVQFPLHLHKYLEHLHTYLLLVLVNLPPFA